MTFMEVRVNPNENVDNSNESKHIGLNESLQHGGPITVTSSGGFHQEKATKVNIGEGPSNYPGGDSVLATLKTKTGRPLNDMTKLDGATVTVNGMEMSIDAAIAAGLLAKGADGTIGGTNQGQILNEQQKQSNISSKHQARAVEVKTSPNSKDLDEMRSKLGSWSVDQQVSQAISQAILDKSPEHIVNTLSRETGKTPEQVFKTIDTAIKGTQIRAEFAITEHTNLDGKEVMEWFHNNVRNAARASLMNRLYLNDASALNEVVSRYKLGNKS